MSTDVLYSSFSHSELVFALVFETNEKKNKTTSVSRLEFRSNFAKRNRRLLAVYPPLNPKG